MGYIDWNQRRIDEFYFRRSARALSFGFDLFLEGCKDAWQAEWCFLGGEVHFLMQEYGGMYSVCMATICRKIFGDLARPLQGFEPW